MSLMKNVSTKKHINYFIIIIIVVVIIAVKDLTMYILTNPSQASLVQQLAHWYNCVFRQLDQTHHQLWQSPPHCTCNPNTCTNSNKQMVTCLLDGVTMSVFTTNIIISWHFTNSYSSISLPPSVTASQSLQAFRKRLKTELFQRSHTTASLPWLIIL